MRSLLGLTLLMLLPVFAFPEDTPDELEHNRRKLQELRRQPEQLLHLHKERQAFLALPEDQQKRIVSLDRDLHDDNTTHRAKLNGVLSRYVEWLDKLDERDRQRIKDAPDKQARLAAIKELRDQEWMRAQPKVQRERYAALQGEARSEFIKKLRLEDRQRRWEWHVAKAFWKELDKGTPLPCRLNDFGNDVVSYFNEYMQYSLSPEEKDRLDKAVGEWPLYAMTLVELADKHPPALPGPDGPRYIKELPQDVQKRFVQKGKATAALPSKRYKDIKDAEGKWPEFGIAVSQFAATPSKKGLPVPLPHELFAWNRSCLSDPMKEFVGTKLAKVLDSQEQLRLIDAETKGKWPDYPQTILELAKKHDLQVPWQTLPGPRERWDGYRTIRNKLD